MGLFTKKADPITSKAKALNQQIAALEAEIKQLSSRVEAAPAGREVESIAHPQIVPVRSTAIPQGARAASNPQASVKHNLPREPIFESVEAFAPSGSAPDSAAHFNDLGVRKYDLRAAWERLRRVVRGPSAHNPKLVSYLAAGSIRGLRPLRYEKRIARNRFIWMTGIFLFILYGLFLWLRP
jgi:hypothetical protein